MPNRNELGRTQGFRGLDNVHEPEKLPLDWSVRADNVELDDARTFHKRRGFTQVLTGDYTTAFATTDASRMYAQEGSTLYRITGDMQRYEVASLVSPEPLRADDINGVLYATNGTDSLVLEADQVRTWGLPVPPAPRATVQPGSLPTGQYIYTCTFIADDGRESGAAPITVIDVPADSSILFQGMPQQPNSQTAIYLSTHDGQVLYRVTTTRDTAAQWDGPEAGLAVSLRTQGLYPPPGGSCIAGHLGRIYIGQHMPQFDASAIWSSEPISYELFRLVDDFIQVPGEVRLLVGYTGGLIIGTDRAVLIETPDGQLQQVFDYGVPRSIPAAKTERGVPVIWTVRGLATPGEQGLENQTEAVLTPEHGEERASLSVVRQDGYEKAVIVSEE